MIKIWTNSNVGTIISLAGALLGTVLGWFLNELSNKGRLKFFLKSYKEDLYRSSGFGGKSRVKNAKEANEYSSYFIIEVYNSSRISKAIWDVQVVYRNGKDIECGIVPDDKLKPLESISILRYDKVGVYNFPGNTITTMELICKVSDKMSDGLKFLEKTNKIYLQYKNEHGKIKKVKLRKTDYSNWFGEDGNS